MGPRSDHCTPRHVQGPELIAADAERIGSTLGLVHAALRDVRPPPTADRWPWPWLDPGEIRDADLRAAATRAVKRANDLGPAMTHGMLHGDPAPEAFIDRGATTALIDWGASVHGPLLYDVASAVMYAGRTVLPGYAATGPLTREELEHLDAFRALRWAVQAWSGSASKFHCDSPATPSAQSVPESGARPFSSRYSNQSRSISVHVVQPVVDQLTAGRAAVDRGDLVTEQGPLVALRDGRRAQVEERLLVLLGPEPGGLRRDRIRGRRLRGLRLRCRGLLRRRLRREGGGSDGSRRVERRQRDRKRRSGRPPAAQRCDRHADQDERRSGAGHEDGQPWRRRCGT